MARHSTRHIVSLLFVFTIGGTYGSAKAASLDDLGDLVGYTIISEETIDDFEGCEYGKTILFSSGLSVTCSEYGYDYNYYVDAVILARVAYHQDTPILLCRMVVEDEIYDVDCNQYMPRYIGRLRILRDQSSGNLRNFLDERLQVLQRIGIRYRE